MPLALYSRLGIKVFTVFDADGDEASDKDAHTDYNMALLKMAGEPSVARPETKICKSAAVWKTTFVRAVKEGFGEAAWNEAFAAAREEFSIPAEQATKKFAVIWRTTESLLSKGIKCELLEKLWQAITSFFNLAPPPPPSTGG